MTGREAAESRLRYFARLASLVGLRYAIDTVLGYVNETGTWVTKTSRAFALKTAESLGSIVGRFGICLDDIKRPSTAKPSDGIRELFERWSIRFSPEYYEAKEREEAGCLTSSLSRSAMG
jgi:hypothetical protein